MYNERREIRVFTIPQDLNLQEHCDSLQSLNERTSAEIMIEVLTAVKRENTDRQLMKLCNMLKCVKVLKEYAAIIFRSFLT
jgi:hypothetical protein